MRWATLIVAFFVFFCAFIFFCYPESSFPLFPSSSSHYLPDSPVHSLSYPPSKSKNHSKVTPAAHLGKLDQIPPKWRRRDFLDPGSKRNFD